MALVAVPSERLQARSALARAPAAGLRGGAGTQAAGFPRREPEGRPWRFGGRFCAGEVSGSLAVPGFGSL